MKRFVLATLMAFLAMSFLRAEDADKKVKTDANIIGHVIEVSTGDHVPGVSIFLKGTTIGTVSDNTGHFRLMDLPLGKKTVVMKAVGYKTKEQEVVLKDRKSTRLNSSHANISYA